MNSQMGHILRCARVYLRSEAMLAELRLQSYLKRLALLSVGIFASVMALVFLNVAAYLELQNIVGSVWTSLILALANLVLVGVIAVFALLMPPSRALSMARQNRKLASDILDVELDHVSEQSAGLSGGNNKMFDLAVSAIIFAIGLIRRRKATQAAE